MEEAGLEAIHDTGTDAPTAALNPGQNTVML